jgi:hypothetical protein
MVTIQDANALGLDEREVRLGQKRNEFGCVLLITLPATELLSLRRDVAA